MHAEAKISKPDNTCSTIRWNVAGTIFIPNDIILKWYKSDGVINADLSLIASIPR
jgi:hypothetical protein